MARYGTCHCMARGTWHAAWAVRTTAWWTCDQGTCDTQTHMQRTACGHTALLGGLHRLPFQHAPASASMWRGWCGSATPHDHVTAQVLDWYIYHMNRAYHLGTALTLLCLMAGSHLTVLYGAVPL